MGEQRDVTGATPAEINRAWIWFLYLTSGLKFGAIKDVDDETAERYLVIVNEQARLHNMPGAIPDGYRVKGIW